MSKVVLVGDRPEKVFVEFSHAKLATLGVTPRQLFDSLAKQNAVAAAGSVDTAHDRVFVRVDGALDAADRVRDVPVEAGGKLFRLGDVAEVRRGYEDPPEFTVRHNGKPAVGLSVAMAPGGNVIDLGKALRAEAEKIKADLPAGAELHEAAFQPKVVDESVSEFVRSFVEALAIVLAVSFLTLGVRTGVVVALSVPLVLAICFVVMRAAGINLDRITLGALIIALGLLVDDAIITAEMMVVKMEEGWDRVRAATFAWTSTAKPMLTGTLITAAGFLPVGFAQSSLRGVRRRHLLGGRAGAGRLLARRGGVHAVPRGEAAPGLQAARRRARTRPVPVAVLPGVAEGDHACVRRPWAVAAVTLALFAAAVVGFGHVKKQFFPQSARPELLVDLQLPEGSSFRAAEGEVAKVEALLKDDADVKSFSSYTGAGSPRFYLSLNPDLPDPSFAKVVIVTRDTEARERVVAKLRGAFAEGKEFPNARGRVSRLDMGPPVGFPVQFRVVGPDPAVARKIAEDVRDVVRRHPDTRDTEIDWGETVRSVRLKVDQDRARALGLTPQDVSETLQSLLTGVTVTQYREGTELIDVVARAVPAERLDLGSLPDVNLPSRSGAPVPLAQVATAAVSQEPPILRRWNREPTVIVRADVADGVQPPDVTAALLPQLQAIRDRLPPGYRIETGGSAEESGKANVSLFAVLPVMVLAMLTLLDGAAPGLPQGAAGVPDLPAGADRGDGRPARVRRPVRVRGPARGALPGRDGHAELGHPGGPDRPRPGSRCEPVGGGDRGDGAAGPAGGADVRGGDPGDDPADPQRVLGADGDRHHGRAGGGDGPDPGDPAGPLRAAVPRQAAGRSGPARPGDRTRDGRAAAGRGSAAGRVAAGGRTGVSIDFEDRTRNWRTE